MGRRPGTRDLLLNLGTPSISKDTKFEFGMWIADEKSHLKIAKLGQLGTRSGSRDILFNFRTPSISDERLKIQTSKLVCRLTTRDAIQKIAKLGQMGRRPATFKFSDPLYI